MEEVVGLNNEKLADKMIIGNTYRDNSLVCIIPSRGMVNMAVIKSWFGLIFPMNHKHVRLFVVGHEIGIAYNSAIDTILKDEKLRKFKYVLCLEDDIIPQADGIVRLLNSIGDYDAISGLYWTKGEDGKPMIYGDPNIEDDTMPQQVINNTIQPCNGIGMGFTLMKMHMFLDGKIDKPFFWTQEISLGQHYQMGFTQDMYFCAKARKVGYKFAVDTSVKCGHWDNERSVAW